MRLLPDNTFEFSPNDLKCFLEGDFAAWCERLTAERKRKIGSGDGKQRDTDHNAIEPDGPDEELDLVKRLGIEHEAAHLASLRMQHPDLVEIPGARDARERTTAAMRAGASVIFQGELAADGWMGIADFLHRIEGTSALGDWLYEPSDTKLARSVKPHFLLQLCAYAEMLEATQGRRPQNLHFVLGTGDDVAFRTEAFWHYYRRLKASFHRFQTRWHEDALPDPGIDRSHGRWTTAAARILAERDDLALVASITRSQIVRLREAGIGTLTALGEAPLAPIPSGFTSATWARVRKQAEMQLRTRRENTIAWKLRDVDPAHPQRGLALLPPPSTGDVFFDIEGFPHARDGLEYLFGTTTVEEDGCLAFRDWWAHDDGEERRAFEAFIDWIWTKLKADPEMHVYHYADYERTALTRLMSKYGTREYEVDQLLRHDVLVNLLTVVRQGLVIGTPSYSLKDIEHLYMPARTEEITSAGGSIVEYQKWIDSGEPRDWRESPILEAIRTYNKVDCDSTAHLRDWLLERQREAGIKWIRRGDVPETAVSDREPSPTELFANELLNRAAMQAEGSEQRRVTELLAWLLEFHRRDDKPMWWRFFERLTMTEEELFEDPDCLAAVVRTDRQPWPEKKSLVYEYAFDPDQDTKLHAGSKCHLVAAAPIRNVIQSYDSELGRLTLKIGIGKTLPPACNLIPDEHVPAEVIVESIERYVRAWAAGGPAHQSVDDLIHRRRPRLTGRPDGSVLGSGDLAEQTLKAVRAMDSTTLAIQGPPGTGKTTTAAIVIAALVHDGQRIGIVANSHSVVLNLLRKIIEVSPEITGKRLFKVGGDGDEELLSSGKAHYVKNPADAAQIIAAGPLVIGGTAWLFSRPEMARTLDYLFIDEAGQVSLANAVGVGMSARNLILMGDQMQLAQPTQGVHPGESGSSCLSYLLQDHAVIPDDLGIFLGRSYRMHPDVCRFISEAFYEGQLGNAPITEHNRIHFAAGNRLSQSTGVTFIPVEHQGRTQGSEEEVKVIRGLVDELLRSEVTVNDKPTRPMTLGDILIVAPFNMQVRALKAALGAQAHVGSVDKFQGQEAPVVIVSMCASTLDDAPRGAAFLLSPNRLNVAISRAQALAIVVGSPQIGDVRVRTIDEMRLVSTWARVEGVK